MKQFKLHLLLFLTVLIVGFASCTEDDIIQRESDKMIGTWFFDKVTVSSFLSYENITADYRNDEIEFQTDGTVIYTQGNGTIWEGIWAYEIINTSDTSEGEIVLSLTNTQTNEQVIEIWENVFVTQQVIRAQEDMNGENVNYKLRKI